MAVPALITAGGALGGAALGGKAQSKATAAQAKAASDALAYQKQKDIESKAMYEKSMADYQQKWQAWENNRENLLKRYGVDIGPASSAQTKMAGGSVSGLMGAPTPGAPSAVQPGLPAPPGAQPAVSQPQNIAQLMGEPAQLGRWNDWKAQGLPSA